MSDYPHTIDNGAGEKLTFVGIRSDERGEYLEARNRSWWLRLFGLHRRFADAPEPVSPR